MRRLQMLNKGLTIFQLLQHLLLELCLLELRLVGVVKANLIFRK